MLAEYGSFRLDDIVRLNYADVSRNETAEDSRLTALLIDFGSTYTKLRAVTLEPPRVVAAAQGPSTVDSDITVGMELALEDLRARLGKLPVCLPQTQSGAAGGRAGSHWRRSTWNSTRLVGYRSCGGSRSAPGKSEGATGTDSGEHPPSRVARHAPLRDRSGGGN